MAKAQFVKDLVEGVQVDDVFSVKLKKPPREYQKGYMFEMRVSDRTGIISLKYWGPNDLCLVDRLYQEVTVGSVVRVRGRVACYRDLLEISVPEGGILPVDCSAYDVRDFVPSTDRDVDQMMGRIYQFIRQVEDRDLERLLRHFFSDEEFVARFRECPASIEKHSNHLGGLLEHTLAVVELCSALHRLKPMMDRDLLITGAILHDLGKMEEYNVTTNISMSEGGMLMGHVYLGARRMDEAARLLQLPNRLRGKLVHMVLSSHGRYEYGSPRIPQFPEAVAVYYADEMDARVEQFIQVKRSARTDDDWTYNGDLKHVYLR